MPQHPEPDLSEFVDITNKRGKKYKASCKVAETTPKLKDEERAQFLAALDRDPGEFPGSVVAAWAEKRGHALTHQAVHFHRLRKCACYD